VRARQHGTNKLAAILFFGGLVLLVLGIPIDKPLVHR
jgi:hypothetical protein